MRTKIVSDLLNLVEKKRKIIVLQTSEMFVKYLRCALTFSFFFFFSNTWAQFGASVPSVNPVTPNSAALFKATERPVGAFTGTTPINIPLYTITAGPLQVPVSLNYNNGGIKVEEIASSVGLGFNLSAGGRITRVLKGLPDDHFQYGYLFGTPIDRFPHYFGGNAFTAIASAIRSEIDIEPDLFYLDCNGITGKFYLAQDGTPHMVEQSNLKIEVEQAYQTFVVTDEKGTKYYFGNYAVDRTTIRYISDGVSTYPPYLNNFISAWHLYEIVDLSGQHRITFSYSGVVSYVGTQPSASWRIGGLYGGDCVGFEGTTVGQESTTVASNNELALTRIQGANGKLEFNISTNREDAGGYQVDWILLKDLNNNIISRHHFNYDYFVNYPGDHSSLKRLKLKDFSQFASTGNDSLPYKFEYIESTLLPGRFSRDTDYWGYYNGPNYNTSLLPKGVYTVNNVNLHYNGFAERRADPYFSQSNTLKKITYPTGGYREFVYEGNTALREEFSHVYPDKTYILERECEATTIDLSNPYGIVAEQSFTIDSDYGDTEFSFYFDDGFNDGYSTGFSIKIYRVNGTSESEVTYFSPSRFSAKVFLQNGNYKIKLQLQNFIGYPNQIRGIYGSWNELSMTSELINRYGANFIKANMNVGGIRVKEVRDFDPVSNKINTTKYSYTLPSDPTLTSGLLITPISLLSFGGNCSPSFQSVGERDCGYVKLSTSSDYPLATEGGSYVVYPEVRTYEEGNGYIDREYSFAFDGDQWYGSYISSTPVVPLTDYSRFRNKLLKEKFFNNDGELLKQTSSGWYNPFAYSDGFTSMMHSQLSWKTVGYWKCLGFSYSPTTSGVCNGCWEPYYYYSGYGPIANTTSTTYGAGEGVELKTEYDYYSDRKQTMVKQKRVYLNDNKIRYTDYRYAFQDKTEFQYPLSVNEDQIKVLLNAEHYAEPLETVTYIKKGNEITFIEGQKVFFDKFNGYRLHLAKLRSYFADGSSVDYTMNYDSKGNLSEKAKQHDAKEVYLWGYNGEYPIAKVIGSDIATVKGIVSQAQIDAAISNDTQLRNLLNTLRTSLPNAMVSTFTYAPLIGMTSATDPKGVTIYYEYDNFGRLMHMKDKDGNILKKHEYKYVTQ